MVHPNLLCSQAELGADATLPSSPQVSKRGDTPHPVVTCWCLPSSLPSQGQLGLIPAAQLHLGTPTAGAAWGARTCPAVTLQPCPTSMPSQPRWLHLQGSRSRSRSSPSLGLFGTDKSTQRSEPAQLTMQRNSSWKGLSEKRPQQL